MKPTIPSTLFRLLAGALLLSSANSVSAALATANAQIDWSTLKITPLGTAAITFDFQNPNDFSGVNGKSDRAPDWTTGTLASYSSPASNAMASTTTTGLSANISASDTGPITYISAEATRSADFSVIGSGVVLFEVDYNVSSVLASALAGLSVSWTKPDGGSGLASAVGSPEFDPTTANLAGALRVAAFFQDGTKGSIDAQVNVAARSGTVVNPIPIPAGVWLLASSLLALAGLRRKQQNAA